MAADKMSSRERVLAALNKQPVDRIPYCELNVDVGVGLQAAALMGKSSSLDVQKLYSNITSPRDYYGAYSQADHVVSGLLQRDNITFMTSLGCFDSWFQYQLNPAQSHLGLSADGIIKTRDDIKNLKFLKIEDLIKDAKEFLKNKGDFAACAELYLGIDPVWHSIGFEDFSVALIEDPEFVQEFMARVCGFYAEVAEELCKLDFDFIWAADDIAYHHATLFSPQAYRDVLLPYTKKVAEKITKPWIYHSDGNLMPIWDDLISQGMNAIHPLEPGSMDLEKLRDNYKKKITFVGGVALTILEGGTVEETIEDTKHMIDLYKGKASYMLCTCNTVTSNVVPENLKAMLETLRKYGNMDI